MLIGIFMHFNRKSFKQTVKTLIRGRKMWDLICVCIVCICSKNGTPGLTLNLPNRRKAEFANNVEQDVMAHNHNEPSHLDLQCLPSNFLFST